MAGLRPSLPQISPISLWETGLALAVSRVFPKGRPGSRLMKRRAAALLAAVLASITCLTQVGCSSSAVPQPAAVRRAAALQASRVALPYTDPLHTFTVRRPQTWVAMDARTAPSFAHALGDSVRFFEPVNAVDPDAGSSGKLWIDVVAASGTSSPRGLLLQPFVDADYPDPLLRLMSIVPTKLGGVTAYRLLTPAGRTQATILLVRWRDRYYRITFFSAAVPAEVGPVLQSWRFLPARH